MMSAKTWYTDRPDPAQADHYIQYARRLRAETLVALCRAALNRLRGPSAPAGRPAAHPGHAG